MECAGTYYEMLYGQERSFGCDDTRTRARTLAESKALAHGGETSAEITWSFFYTAHTSSTACVAGRGRRTSKSTDEMNHESGMQRTTKPVKKEGKGTYLEDCLGLLVSGSADQPELSHVIVR
jgi:hypothetical protein